MKEVLLDAKISAGIQTKLHILLHTSEDIMSSSSNDLGYTKCIKMNTETDINVPPIASKPYTLPLKHQEQVIKELEDLEKPGIIQRSLSPCAPPIVIIPQKCHCTQK